MARLRVVTWNVHGCVGSDRRFNPERIAEVLERHRPDLVLLQEVGDLRGIHPPIDQATAIAELMGMSSSIAITVPSMPFGYGNVTLTRPAFGAHGLEVYDMSVGPFEPRVCMCLSVAEVRCANVHFGLRPAERRRQLRILLAEHGPLLHQGSTPVVLGGDFNDWPPGIVTRHLTASFVDAASRVAARPAKTFPSFHPLLRLDRLYVRGPIEVLACEVDGLAMAAAASDHLPLWAELDVRPDL